MPGSPPSTIRDRRRSMARTKEPAGIVVANTGFASDSGPKGFEHVAVSIGTRWRSDHPIVKKWPSHFTADGEQLPSVVPDVEVPEYPSYAAKPIPAERRVRAT